MNTQQILKALEFYDSRVLPKSEIQTIIDNPTLFIPELLKVLDRTEEEWEDIAHNDDYKGYYLHFYALYLLAQFRTHEAYLPTVKLFSLPGDISLKLTGSMVTDDLPRIFSSMACGDPSLIQSTVENISVNEWVRGACVRSLVSMYACGELSRDDIIAYFRELLLERLEKHHSHVWNALISSCNHIYPIELYDEIKMAYQDQLVEGFFIDLGTIDDTLKQEKETVLHRLQSNERYHLLTDTISELQNWRCFRPEPEEQVFEENRVQQKNKKIGRNDKCPCGSGQKYKKCCLRKTI